jgi:hypothetical protein
MAFTHQLLTRITRGWAAQFDPREAAAYREAAREAFRTTGELVDAPGEARTGSPADMPSPVASADGRLESVVRPPAYERKPGPSRAPAPRAPTESKIVDPGAISAEVAITDPSAPGQAQNQAKASAPGDLLREPANVTRVADDFFDGVVRRVEGDR